MADYADLTPDQLIMLRNMGLLGGNVPTSMQANYGGQFGGFGISNMAGSDRSMTSGRGNINIPVAGMMVTPSANMMQYQQPGYESTMAMPGISAQMGNVSANYGQRYQNGKMQDQSYGGSVDLGPMSVNYNRSLPTGYAPMDMYGINIPIGKDTLERDDKGRVKKGRKDIANINANMITSKDMPTNYQAGINIPGLLGGALDISGEITPEMRDKALYARYTRMF